MLSMSKRYTCTAYHQSLLKGSCKVPLVRNFAEVLHYVQPAEFLQEHVGLCTVGLIHLLYKLQLFFPEVRIYQVLPGTVMLG